MSPKVRKPSLIKKKGEDPLKPSDFEMVKFKTSIDVDNFLMLLMQKKLRLGEKIQMQDVDKILQMAHCDFNGKRVKKCKMSNDEF